jgi:hypothetical protein
MPLHGSASQLFLWDRFSDHLSHFVKAFGYHFFVFVPPFPRTLDEIGHRLHRVCLDVFALFEHVLEHLHVEILELHHVAEGHVEGKLHEIQVNYKNEIRRYNQGIVL